jgi:hypothetical protein
LEIEMAATGSDADVMVPPIREVTVAGERLVIPKIKVKHVTAVIKLVKPFIGRLESTKVDVVSLIENNLEDLTNLLALLLNWDKAKVENLDMDEMVELTAAVLEVNFDFFAQKVLPSLLGAMGRLGGLSSSQAKQLGPTPSNT